MKRPYLNIIYISDIHIGKKIIGYKAMKHQLKTQFLDSLYSMKHVDLVVLAGDVADYVLGMGTKNAKLFMWFGKQLLDFAKYSGCEVVAVRGTPSHDGDQLNMWYEYVNNDYGVKFTVCENYQSIYVLHGLKMLVLPDKKINKSEVQLIEALLTQEYDLVVGHGIIDKVEFFEQESENMSTMSYKFPVEKLMSISKGPVVFGHIHPFLNIKDKFFYCGSFTKLERSEGEHGFLACLMLRDDPSVFKMIRVINEESFDSHTITISRDELAYYDVETIVRAVNDHIKANAKPNDLIMVKMKLDEKPATIDKVMMIENHFKNHRYNITVVKKLKSKREEVQDQIDNDKKDKFKYLMDSNMSVEEILTQYFLEVFSKSNPEYMKLEMSPEIIRNALYPDGQLSFE